MHLSLLCAWFFRVLLVSRSVMACAQTTPRRKSRCNFFPLLISVQKRVLKLHWKNVFFHYFGKWGYFSGPNLLRMIPKHYFSTSVSCFSSLQELEVKSQVCYRHPDAGCEPGSHKNSRLAAAGFPESTRGCPNLPSTLGWAPGAVPGSGASEDQKQ